MSVFLLVGLATAQQPDAFQDYVDGEVRVRKSVGNLTTLLSTKRYNILVRVQQIMTEHTKSLVKGDLPIYRVPDL